MSNGVPTVNGKISNIPLFYSRLSQNVDKSQTGNLTIRNYFTLHFLSILINFEFCSLMMFLLIATLMHAFTYQAVIT